MSKLQLFCGAEPSLVTRGVFAALTLLCFVLVVVVLFPALQSSSSGAIDAFPKTLQGFVLLLIANWLWRVAKAGEWGTPFNEAVVHRVLQSLDPEHLEELAITSMPLTVNRLPEDLGRFTKLRALTVSNSVGLSSLPSSLSACTKLEKLDVYGCSGLVSLPDLSASPFAKAILDHEAAEKAKNVAAAAAKAAEMPGWARNLAPEAARRWEEEEAQAGQGHVRAPRPHDKFFYRVNDDLDQQWVANGCKATANPSFVRQRIGVACDGAGVRMRYRKTNCSAGILGFIFTDLPDFADNLAGTRGRHLALFCQFFIFVIGFLLTFGVLFPAMSGNWWWLGSGSAEDDT